MDALQERPYTVLDKCVPGPRSRLPNFDDRPHRKHLRPLDGIPRVRIPEAGALVGGTEAFCSGIPHQTIYTKRFTFLAVSPNVTKSWGYSESRSFCRCNCYHQYVVGPV